MGGKQTLIENGEMTIEQFVDELYNDLIPMISNANSAEIKVSPSAPSGQSQRLSSPCPSCGKQIVIRPKAIPVQDVNLRYGKISAANH